MAEPTKVETTPAAPATEGASFFDQVQGNPDGHVTQGDLSVEGDAFSGVGKEVQAAVEADATAAAAAKETPGQVAASPPVEDKGQATVVDPPAATEKPEASATDTSAVKSEEGKPLPFDQDPKWIAARAAEKAVNDILEANGLESIDQIGEMLKTGVELQDIIGDQDAKMLIEKAQKMDNTEKFWSEQEALQRKSEESPEQTTVRLEKEITDLRTEMNQKEVDRVAVDQNRQAINEFESTVDKAVDASGLSADEQSIARNLLGVDNPIDTVDIDNRGKTKTAIGQGVEKFEKFIADIKQTAVDEYAAGQSKITPVPSGVAATKTVHVEKKALNPHATVQESFDDAKTELTEIFKNMAAEGD